MLSIWKQLFVAVWTILAVIFKIQTENVQCIRNTIRVRTVHVLMRIDGSFKRYVYIDKIERAVYK